MSKTFWDYVQEHVTVERKSCFACFHLKTRDHATRAICEVHYDISFVVERPVRHGLIASGGARNCEEFDTEIALGSVEVLP